MQGSGWFKEVVLPNEQGATATSIALDSNDYPHMIYINRNGTLFYANRTGGAWNRKDLETTSYPTLHNSMVLDSNDHPHIAYHLDNGSWEGLRYATWTGSDWSIESIDSGDDLGQSPSIAVDSRDNPHIVYMDPNAGSGTSYAYWTGGNWNIQEVPIPGVPSLVLDSYDNPRASYCYNRTLQHAEYDGSNWSIQIVDMEIFNRCAFTSMALDSKENSHISYHADGSVRYANRTSGLWARTTVDYDTEWGSLSIDNSDNPHLTYNKKRGHLHYDLIYAKFTGSGWKNETVESHAFENHLALDSSDNPHVVYDLSDFNIGQFDVKYATKANLTGNQPPVADAGPDQTVNVGEVVQFDGSGSYDLDAHWRNVTVDSNGSFQNDASLALDDKGFPHISYQDGQNGTLMYAKWTGSYWSTEIVDSIGDPHASSIALDKNDRPHIAYSISGKKIAYAKWNGTWNIEVIGPGLTRVFMALDKNDHPHLGYLDPKNITLEYAKWNGTGWEFQTVDTSCRASSAFSLALDSQDFPHMIYQSGSPCPLNLNYARWNGTAWNIETVDSRHPVGYKNSIAIDSNDHPHISHVHIVNPTTQALIYVRWNGTAWENETIDIGSYVGKASSISIDSRDNPHISYQGFTYPVGIYEGLKYAKWDGTTWNLDVVDPDAYAGGRTSLAIDANDNPHIGYADQLTHRLKYATKGKGIVSYDWDFDDGSPHGTGVKPTHRYNIAGIYNVTLTVTDALGATDADNCIITVLQSGQPPVADAGSDQTVDEGDTVYFDGSGSYDPDGGWEWTTVDSVGGVGRFNSIDLDSGDKPHVSYYRGSGQDLKYAKWNGIAWINETVDSTGDVGKYSSLALDSGDYPHISYQDHLNGDLKYAKWNGSAWQIRIVDNEHQSTGRYTAIAIDSNDFPHISYIAEHKGVRILRYARWDGMVWRPETVVPGPWASGHTSIAIDSKDRPHISYYDGRSVGGLMYAKWDGTTWNIEMVEQSYPGSLLLVGAWNSIAIDSNDNPHISYMDGKNESVKYARWDGSAWSIEIACASDRGHTSLALDRNDNPHISHPGYHRSGLTYARWNGSAWNNETVENGSSKFVSMALDQNDSPHITYWNETNGDLRYAKKGRGILSYEWDFNAGVDSDGDGDFTNDADGTGQTPTNVYEDNGNYTVTLKVTDISGLWDTDTCIVTVLNVPPTADANGPYNGFEGTPIHFNGSHTDPGANDTHTYEWDFNYDGATFTPDATGNPYQKTWYDDYTGSIALRVTDDDGGWDLDVTTVTIVNVPPRAEAGEDRAGYEVVTLFFNGSFYDPGSGDTHTFEWDYDYDGITFDVEATGQSATHTFIDDFDGEIALRVTDDDGGVGIDTAHILVKNVPPTVTLQVLPIEVDAFLRIAGEKWHDASIELFEDGLLFANGTLVRYPGSPNDQMLDLSNLQFDYSKNYTAIVTYTPDDDPINGQPNGANPCWIILRFSDGQELWIEHTFNVNHPDTYVWEVDLTAAILSHGMTFEATAFDPGADELTFYWDFGDGTNATSFYPNGNATHPVTIMEIINHVFPGSGTYVVVLKVEDDDGGSGTAAVTIVIP
jgi:PKD repeat protein